MWIIAKYDKINEKSMQKLYYCGQSASKSSYFVPRVTGWKSFDDKAAEPMCIRTSWRCSDELDTNTDGNIFDINVRNAILIDIYKFRGYHSWWKHLPRDGREYMMIPKMYGQIRGYHNENRKINQIRWHCVLPKYCPEKTNKYILDIVKKDKYKYKFNNQLRSESEDNDIQIENALRCGYEMYDEIVELFRKWIQIINKKWIKNNYNEYAKIPDEILSIIVMYCDIGFPHVFEKKDPKHYE